MLFGAITIFAGGRVLAGTNPGYIVFLPLLIYNTLMGFAYVGVGTAAWRNLNLIVLAAIGIAYAAGEAVAKDGLGAMTLRMVVWLVVFSGLWWLGRRNTAEA